MARAYDHTSMGGAARRFPATQWTRILDFAQREAVFAELCRDYWKPVYCYLRAMGFGNEQAKDLVQGFFTNKVLGQDLVRKADREKGRFRSFLLRSVRNYAVSVQRASKLHRSLDDGLGLGSTAGDPDAQFNRAWADQLLQEVLEELEQECDRRGKMTHWHVFRDWLLQPQASRAMNEICRKYGVEDATKAYHMLENIKRRFRAILRSRLSPLAGSDDEVETEIQEFISIFSGGAART